MCGNNNNCTTRQVNPKAYCYGEEMDLFMRGSWARRNGISPLASRSHLSMLVLDDYRWHKAINVVSKLKDLHGTTTHHLDGGITPVAQPLDIAPNAIVKHHTRQRYDAYALDAPYKRLY